MSRLLVVLLLALLATALAVRVSTRANVRSDSDSDAEVEADVDVDTDSETHAEVEAVAPHDALDGFVDDQITKLGGSTDSGAAVPSKVGAGAGDFSLAGFSFDSQLDLSVRNFQCIFNQIGGKGFIARAWRSNCKFDDVGKKNIATAWAAGADRVDVYMFPKYTCALTAEQQVDQMLAGLGDAKFSRVWLDVEDGANWSTSDRQANLDWVVKATARLEAKLGAARVGIYSSAVMWQNVFGSSSVATSAAARALAKYPMWYAQYDNKPSYARYTPFANWQKPFLKQYQGDVMVCNLKIDVNWRPNEAGPINPTTGPAPQTCSSGGKSGKCIDQALGARCGTTTVKGLCTGTTTICCLDHAAEAQGTMVCSSAGKSGSCLDVSKTPCSSGSIAHGMCPGSDDVVCCLNSAPKIGASVPVISTNVGVYLSQPFAFATKAELLAASLNAQSMPPKVGSGVACNAAGKPGTCIDTKNQQCSTSTVSGLCAGATTICCLTTAVPNTPINYSKLAGKVPASVLSVLPDIATRYNINTKLRLAHFLSQAATESGSFTITTENLNYSGQRLLEVFPKYFKTRAAATAASYKPQIIGNTVYGGRMGNGNAASGDGFKYRGRGFIQLTGKDAYKSYGTFRGVDAVGNPDLLAGPNALDSAAWFFGKFKTQLLATCDRGSSASVVTSVSLLVNGGDNGLEERKAYFNKFWAALQ